MLKWAARMAALWAFALAVTLAVGAGSARATITFDPATGTGFVPKADLPEYWFSGSRAEQLKTAKKLYFWYGFYHEEEYAVTCSWGPARFFILYRTLYDLSERVVIRNGDVAGWKLLGRDGDARTSVYNMFEGPGSESCTVDALTATYDFVLLYVSHPVVGAPSPYIWRQGEGVCFLASPGDPWAC
jgi:hypothetical protein